MCVYEPPLGVAHPVDTAEVQYRDDAEVAYPGGAGALLSCLILGGCLRRPWPCGCLRKFPPI